MNIGTASYGTGAFRAIGSLSESDIVGLYEYAEQDRLFKDAEEWIFEDDHEWPYSFINICEAVDMNPKYLRKGLLHWRQSGISKGSTLWPAIVLNKGSDKRCA